MNRNPSPVVVGCSAEFSMYCTGSDSEPNACELDGFTVSVPQGLFLFLGSGPPSDPSYINWRAQTSVIERCEVYRCFHTIL